jgi:hypothetical protein
MMSSKTPSTEIVQKPLPGNGKTTRHRGRLLVFVVIGLVILALALGLGLGLGLKHSKSKSSSSGTNNDNGPSLSSLGTQDWRRSTLDYNLDLKGWDFNAPPTTRSYNLSLTEIAAAPDGK